MQSQVSDDTATPETNVPSWRSLKKAALIGGCLLLAGLLMLAYSVEVDIVSPHYHNVTHSEYQHHLLVRSYVVSQRVGRGIMWYFWVPLIIAGGLTLMIVDAMKFEYFREVLEGTIVKQHEETNIFGRRYYFCTIEGKTKAGGVRQQTHEVSMKTYFQKNPGDYLVTNE